MSMVSVSDLMTKTVYTLQPEDSLSEVRALMHLAKIRHTPVTDDRGNFRGLITNRDLLAFTISKLAEIDESVQEEIDTAIRVAEVMQKDVITVTPETGLRDAANLMYQQKLGCLPVLEGKKLVGILTEADFIRLTIDLLAEVE